MIQLAMIEYACNQIKADVKQVVADGLKRISEDPDLQRLINKE
jgi:hypothetical protein